VRRGPAIESWTRAAGEFEALCALAGYAYEHPHDPFPAIEAAGPVFEGVGLRHPLMADSRCIPNSIHLEDEKRLLVVSGSNMSGKSTLLRTVGINAVLAFAGAPVRAQRLRLSVAAIGATLRIQDSLRDGTSAFDAEVRRIARVVTQATPEAPILVLFDELFHGTNPADRRVGAEALFRTLLDSRAIGLVTTHDPAVNEIAALLPQVACVHFEHDVKDGALTFDYQMHSGPAPARLASALTMIAAAGLMRRPAADKVPSPTRSESPVTEAPDDGRDGSHAVKTVDKNKAFTWRRMAEGLLILARRLRI
jgi:DNA mismatch repair ATPase MutS